MPAELFTVATRPVPGLARLQRSLSRFRVPITILGESEPDYLGHAWRWKTFIRAVRASEAEIVVHCDAYDTVCLEVLDNLIAKFATLDHPIVFSYESQPHPEFWLGLQPGLMIAQRQALLTVFHDKLLEELFPDHFNDQYQIQSLYSWHPDAFALDRQGLLFHTLGPHAPDLVVNDNHLVNPITGLSPSFVHAPHNQDLSRIEQWINSLN